MTLDEAIKEMFLHLAEGNVPHTKKIEDAHKLGIEGLKWRKESEQYDSSLKAFPLPGETEE